MASAVAVVVPEAAVASVESASSRAPKTSDNLLERSEIAGAKLFILSSNVALKLAISNVGYESSVVVAVLASPPSV